VPLQSPPLAQKVAHLEASRTQSSIKLALDCRFLASFRHRLLARVQQVAFFDLGKPPSHPWLAVCQSLPASILQSKTSICHLSCLEAIDFYADGKQWQRTSTLIFLPKFRLIFFFLYLESFCFLSSVFRSLIVTSLSQGV